MPEKKKKPLKKEHFEVLLEDIDKKFALVLEGHDALNKKIEDTANESRERDEHLEFLIHTVDGKVDVYRKELKAEISGVRDELKTEISSVKDELGAKIDNVLEKIEDHEVRIVKLEEKVLG